MISSGQNKRFVLLEQQSQLELVSQVLRQTLQVFFSHAFNCGLSAPLKLF